MSFSQSPSSHLTTSAYPQFMTLSETSSLYYDSDDSLIKEVTQSNLISPKLESSSASAYRTERTTTVSFSQYSVYVLSLDNLSSSNFDAVLKKESNSSFEYYIDETKAEVELYNTLSFVNDVGYQYHLILRNFSVPSIFGASLSGRTHVIDHIRFGDGSTASPISSTPFTIDNVPQTYNKIMDLA